MASASKSTKRCSNDKVAGVLYVSAALVLESSLLTTTTLRVLSGAYSAVAATTVYCNSHKRTSQSSRER